MVERIRTLLETRQLTPTQFADAIGIARPIVSHILSGRNKPSLEVVQRILAAMPDISMPWLLNGSGPMLAAPVIPAAVEAQPQPAPPVQPEPLPAAKEPKNQPTNASLGGNPAAAANDFARSSRMVSPLASVAPTADAALIPDVATLAPPAAAISRPIPKRFSPSIASAEPAKPSSDPVPTAETPVADTQPPQPVVAAPAAPAESPLSTEINPPAASFPDAAAFFGSEKPIRRIVIFYRDGSFADYQPE